MRSASAPSPRDHPGGSQSAEDDGTEGDPQPPEDDRGPEGRGLVRVRGQARGMGKDRDPNQKKEKDGYDQQNRHE